MVLIAESSLSNLFHILSTKMTVFWSTGDQTLGFMYVRPELYQQSQIQAPVCIYEMLILVFDGVPDWKYHHGKMKR